MVIQPLAMGHFPCCYGSGHYWHLGWRLYLAPSLPSEEGWYQIRSWTKPLWFRQPTFLGTRYGNSRLRSRARPLRSRPIRAQAQCSWSIYARSCSRRCREECAKSAMGRERADMNGYRDLTTRHVMLDLRSSYHPIDRLSPFCDMNGVAIFK